MMTKRAKPQERCRKRRTYKGYYGSSETLTKRALLTPWGRKAAGAAESTN
jgi:hypothetical protein